jgi:hypothetical protein
VDFTPSIRKSTMSEPLSTCYIDYFQRSVLIPRRLDAQSPLSTVLPDWRRSWRINGIGRVEKAQTAESYPGRSNPSLFGKSEGQSAEATGNRPITSDALTGLYGYKIPVAFQVWGEPNGVSFFWGTWSSGAQSDNRQGLLDSQQAIIRSVLSSLFPVIDLAESKATLSQPPLAGFALGIPTAKAPDQFDGALPWDRLIRAMAGTNWACQILAEPVSEQEIAGWRHQIINEMRSIESIVDESRAPSPLARHYMQLLEAKFASLTQGQAVGGWRTAVYLLGDVNSYYRLASLWRGIFSGNMSWVEPIQVWDSDHITRCAVAWAIPDVAGSPGPGLFAHPYEYQTLLTSEQLAAYVHLPQFETVGFQVKAVPDFDSVPPLPQTADALPLGAVIERSQPTRTNYCVSPKALSRHALVAGVTGSGKTNTIFHLLKQLEAMTIPFLVIEPTKTEYRALANDLSLSKSLRIFTLGNENVSPFRLNPFEVVGWPATSVSGHLDLLRSLFSASFGMWTPLPQVLEQCLHQIYVDYGWDITTNSNYRIAEDADISAAFPTLSDLLSKVNEIAGQLGYEQRVTDDIRAALRTRINGLRIGGKGRMLDIQRSMPMETILSVPTILELEGMGDDDDKAFLIGLQLIRLAEYLRSQGQFDNLRHLLVIEEAHRLLANIGPRGREEEADPRSKAVEAFANLLSEIRAYGQGVVVTDQIPVKLVPDVIKNTNLKIVHRIVAQDDRHVLAGAMAMNDLQTQALAALPVGQAVVFADGDDTPLLIKVPPAKGQKNLPIPNDSRVAQSMAASEVHQHFAALLLPFDNCLRQCPNGASHCWLARPIVEYPSYQRTLSRLILSTIEDGEALDRLWHDLLATARALYPPEVDEAQLLHCLLIRSARWFAERRGKQSGWSYQQTRAFADSLSTLFLHKLDNQPTESHVQQLQQLAVALHERLRDPYPACAQVCPLLPSLCLYRNAVSDMIAGRQFSDAWFAAERSDLASQERGRDATWEVCQDAGYELIEWPTEEVLGEKRESIRESARRVCLCFAQQMLARDSRKSPATVAKVMDKIFREAYK